MWYAANLFFKSVHTPTESTPTLWEESVRLIQASNEIEARREAESLGRSSKHSYVVDGGSVEWVFEKVERVFEITEDIENGCELFSRYLRESEVKSLLTPFK